MRFLLSACVAMLIALDASSQNLFRVSQQIMQEGTSLYRLEKASWLSTDIVTNEFGNIAPRVGGYFSYHQNDKVISLYYANNDTPQALIRLMFDTLFRAPPEADTTVATLNNVETELYRLRTISQRIVTSDPYFSHFQNTSLNLIPIVTNNVRKVYCLTGPAVNDVMLFGNDYELVFDKKHRLKSKKRLHANLMSIEYPTDTVAQHSVTSIHTHGASSNRFITATDVCTLLLYGDRMKCKTHVVVSKTHVSLWDCEEKKLAILTRGAWETMSQNRQGP